MTELQKSTYLAELKSLMVMSQNLYLFDTPYRLYNLTVTAYIQDNFIPSNVKMELEGTIRDYLNHENFQLGKLFIYRKLLSNHLCRGIVMLLLMPHIGHFEFKHKLQDLMF
jgi:hypothetical protein